MIEFSLALTLFLVSHSLPALPGVRPRLVALLGGRIYLALYALVSLLLLAWLVRAALAAPYVGLWPTTPLLALLPIALMLPACVLLVGGLIAPNPLSINVWPEGRAADRAAAPVRHPVLWAFVLWGASHALANGDLVAVILFGGLALFGLVGMKTLDRRRRRTLGEARWRRLAGVNYAWRPFDLAAALLGGGVLYALLLWAHPWLFGVSPLAWLG